MRRVRGDTGSRPPLVDSLEVDWLHVRRVRRFADGRRSSLILSAQVMRTPIANMRAHQSLEDAAVVPNPQVKEFVHDHEILKARILPCEISSECNDARGRA